MRIAQVAPLLANVPPMGAGGPERSISYITEELVRQGHDVTLFATADSQTDAFLMPCSDRPLMLEGWPALITGHMLMIEHLFKQVDDFDIVHNHVDFFPAPLARRYRTPMVTTLHTAILPIQEPLFREYSELALVAISDYQKQISGDWLNWQSTIYHGLPPNLYSFQPHPGKYLAFLGRIVPQKGVTAAIEIATRAGMELKIAGNIDPMLPGYFEEVKPFFKHPLVEYIGEINDQEKRSFLGDAAALLFPIQGPEAFGIVMVEALACGTPVIGTNISSVPEVITDGVTGFTFSTNDQAVAAVRNISTISRQRCREEFEARFTVERMVRDYVSVYESLLM